MARRTQRHRSRPVKTAFGGRLNRQDCPSRRRNTGPQTPRTVYRPLSALLKCGLSGAVHLSSHGTSRIALRRSCGHRLRARRLRRERLRAVAPAGVAAAGGGGLYRTRARPHIALYRAARQPDRRPRHLRPDAALHGRRARRRSRAARFRRHARLPDDISAQHMDLRRRAARRANALRPAGGANRHDGLVLVPRHERPGRRPHLRACLRQRHRHRRLPPRRWPPHHRRARLDAGR